MTAKQYAVGGSLYPIQWNDSLRNVQVGTVGGAQVNDTSLDLVMKPEYRRRRPVAKHRNRFDRPFLAIGRLFTQAAQASSSSVATLVRQTGKPLQASSSSVANLVRQIAKFFQASSASVATRSSQIGKAFQASSSAVASLVRQTGKLLQASSAAIASRTSQSGKPLQASSSSVATLVRSVAKTLQASSPSVATLARSLAKSFQASSAAVASIVKQTNKLLQAPYIAKAVHFAIDTKLNNNSLASTDNQYFSSVFWINASAQGKTIWQGAFATGIIGNFNSPTDNKIKQTVSPNSIASVLSAQSSIVLPSGVWTCVICAFETDFSAGNKLAKVYFGDTDVTGAISDLAASFNVQMNGHAFALGSSTLGSAMDLADVRIMPGINLLTGGDIVQATRRLFVDANGFPVDPQVATAALGAPAVLFSGDSTSFGTNQGGGGSFTASGTALANATTSPSDGARPVASLVRQIGLIRTASSAVVASLVKAIALTRQASSVTIASMIVQLGKGLSAASASVASLSLQTGKFLQASSSAIASLVRSTSKLFQAESDAVATATAQKSSNEILAQAVSNAMATLTKQFPRSFQASSSAVATLARVVGKVLRAASSSTASLVRSTAKSFQASTAPIATAAKTIPQSAQAVANVVATLVTRFGKGFVARSQLLGTKVQAGLDATRTVAQLMAERVQAALSGTKAQPNLDATKTQADLEGEVDE